MDIVKYKQEYRNPGSSPVALYWQVFTGIAAGIIVGIAAPDVAVKFKLLSDIFIRLVKMMVSPVIFCTVVTGICSINNFSKVGRVGVKALIYFEVLTTFALLLGFLTVKIIKPGKGLNIDASLLQEDSGLSKIITQKNDFKASDFLLNIIPESFFSAFTGNEILQVLFIALLVSIALFHFEDKKESIINGIDIASKLFFKIIHIIMRVAPLGAFGAMAYTVGKFGFASLHSLIQLIFCLYFTCVLFVLMVLGVLMYFLKYNIFKFIRYIKEEIFLVIGTSSSEAALPNLMEKLEKLGCHRSVIGLVIPTGYSFNLDGTSIYLSMALLFLAQATNIHLTLQQELLIIGLFMLTSKGAAAVTGGGFVTLAATLSSIDAIPVAAISVLIGIDRFMSEARAVTNLIGNGVATIVIGHWENDLNKERIKQVIGFK